MAVASLRYLLPIALLCAGSCSESDAVAIRLSLAADGSGTVACAGLRIPTEKAPYEDATKGATWTDRANLYCAKGTFKELASLDLGGIRFALTKTAEGVGLVHAVIPCGKDAAWCGAFAPPPADQRKASATLDPTGKVTSAGFTLKLEIEVPGLVTGVGTSPEMRGASSDKFKQRAELVVPIKNALESTEKELAFDVTYKVR